MNLYQLFKSGLTGTLFLIMSYKSIGQAHHTKIEFEAFSVKVCEKKILLDWIVKDTAAINYFEIQRSADGKNFKTVALVLGPDPNSNKGNNYKGFDTKQTNAKKCYYRLKHVNINGVIDVSETKLIAINK